MAVRRFGVPGLGAALVAAAAIASTACSGPTDGAPYSVPTVDAPVSSGSPPSGGPAPGAASTSAPATPNGGAADTLDANRARLLATYVDYLRANATTPQSNGLSASDATSSCATWSALAPSAQLVFLTLTARLQASKLGADGSSMLSHVTKVYRVAGGENATADDPGSCGGGEFNRMIMSMDTALHGALVAANDHKGAPQGGTLDLGDATNDSFWRDSHDLGGPHAPFDLSDETDSGAPRGQTQFFADPTTAAAHAPLNRQDLESLVDPLALEMDQDYDCTHNSNPACTYTFYGSLCLPEPSKSGVDIYTKSYGSPAIDWKPACQ